jgi:hypothetical protein
MTQQDMAQAIPTKRFFVSMLTRDISLEDAILDLLDNCLDGALRSANGGVVDYSQFSVTIDMDETTFKISDDCGGIPREVAKEYAFKMGREPDDTRDSDSETIGMYGVGMKRAIFKMGQEAIVQTSYHGDHYQVEISPEWLESKDWEPLPIINCEEKDALTISGTSIEVKNLYPGVSRHLKNDVFVNDLKRAIGEHFSIFLQKGLTVTVNGGPVIPALVEILTSTEEGAPAPFIYKKEVDGVLISIVVGLNTGRRYDDDEDIDFERDRSASTAGWTVFCNDRAVIVGDKTRLTGWGDGIPMYHGQFSVITGIVEFRSSSADKLPITTTKRALDTSSDVWLEARTKMREGLRVWINYTNQWKNNPRSDQSKYWESSKPTSLKEAMEVIEQRDVTKKNDGAIEYNPNKKKVLPVPESKKPSSRRIVFSRPAEEIKDISSLLFDREDESPGVVGEKCFELILQKAREETGGEK